MCPRPARPSDPHPREYPARALSGRAWLSSYYLVFLACFLDLAESSKKAHGTEGPPQLRSCQKEGSHQKQSDLQGNQGRHEPARMCSFARLACCRRQRASYRPQRSLRFLSFFGVSVSDPRPAGGHAVRDARGRHDRSRDRAAAAAARPVLATRLSRMRSTNRLTRSCFISHILYEFIGRESSRCLTSSVLVARSPHGFL